MGRWSATSDTLDLQMRCGSRSRWFYPCVYDILLQRFVNVPPIPLRLWTTVSNRHKHTQHSSSVSPFRSLFPRNELHFHETLIHGIRSLFVLLVLFVLFTRARYIRSRYCWGSSADFRAKHHLSSRAGCPRVEGPFH